MVSPYTRVYNNRNKKKVDQTERNSFGVDAQFFPILFFKSGLQTRSLTGWGVEQAAYKFLAPGNYRAEVTINYILFAPVQPDVGKFNIVAIK